MGPRARMGRLALALCAIVAVAACGVAIGKERKEPRRRVVRRAAAAPTPKPTPVTTAAPTPKPRPKPPKKPSRILAQRWAPFARVGGVVLLHPSDKVERVGFHQASDVRDRTLDVMRSAVRPRVLPSRGRPTSARTAADIVVEPHSVIRAPVSGIVKRAAPYRLYCKYQDSFVAISPVGHPELEVKMLHITGLRVRPGDHVTAGKTVIAAHATKFPFVSEVDAFTARPAWPHVHVEATQLAIPSATPQPGKSLTFGCQ